MKDSRAGGYGHSIRGYRRVSAEGSNDILGVRKTHSMADVCLKTSAASVC